jgi:predicted transcriptional regulator
MKKKKADLGKVVTGINLDPKVIEFLNQMAVEMETSRSQVVNHSIRHIMRETEILK